MSIGNVADHLLNGRSYRAPKPIIQDEHRVAFRGWARRRPFVGGVLTMLAGIEMFFSSQLDLGNIHVQVGVEGFQATIIPIALVLLGLLAMLMPQHRIFYGVIALVVAVYSLIGVNLGGFILGMVLGSVGGILIVSWIPRKTPVEPRPLEGRR
jgi:Family of unknown function (DUF6114)